MSPPLTGSDAVPIIIEMIGLVVFLGNPGDRYAGTRHNAGWMLLQALPGAESLIWREKFHGRSADYGAGREKVRFLLPQSFMNLSGKSVFRGDEILSN